jgi:hypothetical protein
MSDPEITLVPIEEKQVAFYEDSITAVLVPVKGRSEVYVPLRPICEYLGLNWTGQLQRLKRDKVLSESQGVCVIHTPSGGQQKMVCLPLEVLPGFLFTIEVSRVRPELQEKITRYRRECFRVLWEAFQADALDLGERAGVEVAKPAPTQQPANPLVAIRDLGKAIQQLAEEQLSLQEEVEAAGQLAADAHTRLDRAATLFKNLTERMGVVENKIAPPTLVTDEQASQIALAVKALAADLTSKNPGKNFFQGVYTELYNRFGVSSYKRIRAGQFIAVIQFLNDWSASGGTIPSDKENQKA